jgi:hypothetical protein
LIFIQEELNNFTWFSGIGERLVSNDNVLNLKTIEVIHAAVLQKQKFNLRLSSRERAAQYVHRLSPW